MAGAAAVNTAACSRVRRESAGLMGVRSSSRSSGESPVGRMRCSSVFTDGRARGAGYRGCRTMTRWRTMKASSRAPMTILVHQELRVPSKEISACTVPRTSTPAIEPAT